MLNYIVNVCDKHYSVSR